MDKENVIVIDTKEKLLQYFGQEDTLSKYVIEEPYRDMLVRVYEDENRKTESL